MNRSNRELWLAFTAILLITIFYLFVVITLGGIPAASEFFGHSLGILGFVLMLMTETLYSVRKRSRSARWGRMASWLEFHIFTGLVGPYLVLLHSSWKFNGLAGVVLWMTMIVVLSGFIGRYIYTAIPRTVDGLAIEAGEIEQRIQSIEAEIQEWVLARPGLAPILYRHIIIEPGLSSNPTLAILSRPFIEIEGRLQWWLAKQKMDSRTRSQTSQLERLVRRHQTLQRQVLTIAQARQMMALWHAIHIPIGMTLFAAACIHITAAIYYATLLH
jgi:hypothetical protein